jgi:hypothetical protein
MMNRILAVVCALSLHCGAEASPSPMSKQVIPLPAGFAPQTLVAADFDGDGNVDIALCGNSKQLLVLAGDKLGGFHPISQNAGCGENPTHLIAVDLDGDGRVDLAVANHDTDYLTVFRNEGGGRFTSRQLHVHSKPHPHTVAAADVNGDGHLDLITDSWSENRLTLLLGDGHGGWQTPGTPIEVGRKPYINVVAADLDGDGNIDLIVPNSGFDTVTILFGDGHGHFEPSTIVAGPYPFTVAVGDVNGDGRPDIVIANYSGHITDIARDGLTWIRNDGRRHFTAFPERVVVGRGSWRIVCGDLNGDRFADVAFTNGADDSVTIAYGSAEGPKPGPKIAVMHEPHNLAMSNRRLFVITEAVDQVLQVSATVSSKSSFSLVQPVIVALPFDATRFWIFSSTPSAAALSRATNDTASRER